MNFNYTIPVSKPVEETWQKVSSPLDMVGCLPGVEEVKETEPNQFQTVVSTKFGPVKLKFNGGAKVAIDEENKQMKADVTMSDKLSGSVYGTFTMDVKPAADGQSSILQIVADVNIAGKMGEFAQPLIKRKADQIIKEFSDNLKKYIG
jgi:carbon monoxide dehydrogenase subunit G